MSRFYTPLEVRMLPEMDDQNWMVITPLVYFSDRMGDFIRVPEGFITNFVSFDALKNVGQRAAVVHDFLYSCNDVPRELADDIFKEALLSVGVDGVLAKAMFRAVRLFGGGHRDYTPYSYFDEQRRQTT